MVLITVCTAPAGVSNRSTISSSVIHTLTVPVGIFNLPYSSIVIISLFIVFCFLSSLNRLTNKALHLLDTLREFLHIAAHFLGCNLRIDLRRADAAVAQHLR